MRFKAGDPVFMCCRCRVAGKWQARDLRATVTAVEGGDQPYTVRLDEGVFPHKVGDTSRVSVYSLRSNLRP